MLGSRHGSPSAPLPVETLNGGTVEDDSVTCVWDNCGVVYTHLGTLIEHIHNGKSFFACEEMSTSWPWLGYWIVMLLPPVMNGYGLSQKSFFTDLS
jgi:hypothetical protein